MNTRRLPSGYRHATNPRECASKHALVFDTDLRYWRPPTAWEVTSTTAVIAVPAARTPDQTKRLGLTIGLILALIIIALFVYSEL